MAKQEAEAIATQAELAKQEAEAILSVSASKVAGFAIAIAEARAVAGGIVGKCAGFA